MLHGKQHAEKGHSTKSSKPNSSQRNQRFSNQTQNQRFQKSKQGADYNVYRNDEDHFTKPLTAKDSNGLVVPKLDDLLRNITDDVSRSFVREMHCTSNRSLHTRFVKPSHDLDSLIIVVKGRELRNHMGRGKMRRANSHDSVLSEVCEEQNFDLPTKNQKNWYRKPKSRHKQNHNGGKPRNRPTSDLFYDATEEWCRAASERLKTPKWTRTSIRNPGNRGDCGSSKLVQDSSDYHSATCTISESTFNSNKGSKSDASPNIKTADSGIDNLMSGLLLDDDELEDLKLKIDLKDFIVEKPISGNAILSQPLSNWWPAPLIDDQWNIENACDRKKFVKTKKPLIVVEPNAI